MSDKYKDLINKAYSGFNARDTDAVLALMQKDVHWPNGWEGGYIEGHDEVRDYWARQWKEIDPNVLPVSFKETADGKVEVEVKQLVKDLKGNIIFDAIIKHVYSFENGLIKSMEIWSPSTISGK